MADTQTIKDRIDIVQLLQEYLNLKKAGANWKANCPFHNEKTPSFMVHPEKQIWHCFGCGKGGDIFTFIQEIEGLDFIEALKLLADRAGVKLTDSRSSEINKNQKIRLQEINSKVADFFHNFLVEMKVARPAYDYLTKQRGLSHTAINNWQIGYVPDQWDLLTQYMLKKGVGIDDLVSSGLTIKNAERNSWYDRFRGRLMFPIWDVHGSIVGFTGRILVEKENSGGKYVNTPQTALYDKSRVIYGLNKAKQEIKTKDLAVLVEGQMDVIACHEAGMKNVIAASGTSLTDEQVKLIKRFTNNIAIAFDSDMAGQEAAKRGIDAALLAGLSIKVISIPEGQGKDADECIKKNPKSWFFAVESAVQIMDWHFNRIFKKVNLNDFKEKQEATSLFLAELKKIPFAIERESWIRKLSDKIGIEPSILNEELKKIKMNSGAKKGSENISNTASESSEPKSVDRDYLLKQKFWSLIVRQPSIFSALKSDIEDSNIDHGEYKKLYDFVEMKYNNRDRDSKSFGSNIFAEYADQNTIDLLLMQAEKDYCDFSDENRQKEAEMLLESIRNIQLKKLRQNLFIALENAKEQNNEELQNEILKKINDLIK
jgi:DNA primase